MRIEPPTESRKLKVVFLECDLAIVGAGMAGACCAITAARSGLKVILIHDRPVPGGNASSEVRLWVLGATAHMTNNNRWAREGGVIDEILVENTWRNPEGNPAIFDSIILEKIIEEDNITFLLNTAVYSVEKASLTVIKSVTAFCSQNSTVYKVEAPLFCDSSGDGIVGYLSGAAFRMGAETPDEFGEKFAPSEEYGELLGHSIYFYTKDTGNSVKFIPPSFALEDIKKIPRWRQFDSYTYGCRYWWIEYGGRQDTVHDTETIKWELWRIAYGVWNHIKNSGLFPEAENLTIEWMGAIPGKRESRRFEGDYMLRQKDIIEQTTFDDAVSYGGWSIDLHPADGVYSNQQGCNQWNTKGVYPIPYRCLFSRNIENLFLAGRIISSSHVAFGSTRVMATCANSAQAVAKAAAICKDSGLMPRDISKPENIKKLQKELIKTGQFIPGIALNDAEDIAKQASIYVSSKLNLAKLPPDGDTVPLDVPKAMLLPFPAGKTPKLTFIFNSTEPTRLCSELRISSKLGNYTPDITLATKTLHLPAGYSQKITFDFDVTLDDAQYAFICLMANDSISVVTSDIRLTGILSLINRGTQKPDSDIGVQTFELWPAERRPGGKNLAMEISPPLDIYNPLNIINGYQRPYIGANAWVADYTDTKPFVTLCWKDTKSISKIAIAFDTDFDHPMESVLYGQPERAMPFCVKSYRIIDDSGSILYEKTDNIQTINRIIFNAPIKTKSIKLEILEMNGDHPASLFEIRCYE